MKSDLESGIDCLTRAKSELCALELGAAKDGDYQERRAMARANVQKASARLKTIRQRLMAAKA